MTAAICIRCGNFKIGALTVCTQCRLDPMTEESLVAKSLVMSDHHRTIEQLRDASAILVAGGGIPFDEAELARIKAALRELPKDALRMPLGCQVLVWLPLVAMIVLAVF